MTNEIGKTLIILGVLIVLLGIFLVIKDSFPLLRLFGKLPGDINIRKENFEFHFPIVTCIILSALISFILWIFLKMR